jgi:hypothetical protein
MDTISLSLKKEHVPNIDLMAETSQYLTSFNDGGLSYGEPIIYGKLDNLDISITQNRINIKNGSLSKYYLGDNIKEMSRSCTKLAIEKMSDTLHLPLHHADIKKFHFGVNVMLQNEPILYLPYLGNCGHFVRLAQPTSLNYKVANREFAIYDKIKEVKAHRQVVAPLYKDRHMMRLESRYNIGVNNYFNVAQVKANMLYDEAFYMTINKDLQSTYQQITKIKKNKIDMQTIKTKKQLQKLGVLSLIEIEGGILQALENIKERYKKGMLTKKQHYDLKAMYLDSSKMVLQTVDSDLILELDRKVTEKFKYYR